MAPSSLEEEKWDTKSSTRWLFAGLDQEISNNGRFTKFMKRKEDGSSVPMTTQRLQCYYSTIRVIRVPELALGSRRPHLIAQQMNHLYQQITDNCKAIRESKSLLRMALNAEQFSPYLRLAFDHFKSEEGLSTRFDFVGASFIDAAIFPDFASNIKTIAVFLLRRPNMRSETLFTDLTNLIASCIMFDATRNSRAGDAHSLLPEYEKFFKPALQGFFRNWWPCERQGCTNVASGHAIGHAIKGPNGTSNELDEQYQRRDGLDFDNYYASFRAQITKSLSNLLSKLPRHQRQELVEGNEKSAAQRIHKQLIQAFYRKHSTLAAGLFPNYVDHTACLACLIGLANHTLPCGHAICSDCAVTFGTYYGETALKVFECPIDGRAFHSPKLVNREPPLAGVRVLSIDG